MMSADSRTVRLDIASSIDMIEMVQTVITHLSGVVGLSEDATHYMSVAVRESVVNAIKHGNGLDNAKRVAIDFVMLPEGLEVRVADQGKGFDPSSVPDPVAEENLLKAYGRGIFFMRSFMDEVEYSVPAAGGTRVRMIKKKT